MKIRQTYQLLKNMGLRYTLYRVTHAIESKLGLLKKWHPMNPVEKKIISLQDWKKTPTTFVIDTRENLQLDKNPIPELKEKATKILNGEICFFSAEWKNLGIDYNWITNPENRYTYDSSKHWSDIDDFNELNGDIKYVWEKSRFAYLLTIMRYDYHFNEDHSAFVFADIENWIDANPINQGPNWKCSQEISLRIFNWMYLLSFYKNANALTEPLWHKIQQVIYWSLHHVYNHINFSRIAVRNNHAISETLALAVSEMLFPFIPETQKWAKCGRKWFEQEIDYQVYDDGTFLQFSMNYNRVLVQLLSLGISITEKNNRPFSKIVHLKAYKTLNFLYQCLQKENGFLPNYGANDGALFFPLSDTKYRDYRPQLNTLHFILTGGHLFDSKEVQEDLFWVLNNRSAGQIFNHLKQELGTISFNHGGYYLCRTEKTFTFIRCGSHKDRPSHADNLHMDVWVKGDNILRDSGTYKYNTDKELADYFTGTHGHNTVLVNNMSQMLKGTRFIWFYWTQCLSSKWTEDMNYYIFEGSISAFRYLNKEAVHNRQIKISKCGSHWLVKDDVYHLDSFIKKQVWHPNSNELIISSKNNTSTKFYSYNSDSYGQFLPKESLIFEFDNSIETTIKYTAE
jgi:hypothetical protein